MWGGGRRIHATTADAGRRARTCKLSQRRHCSSVRDFWPGRQSTESPSLPWRPKMRNSPALFGSGRRGCGSREWSEQVAATISGTTVLDKSMSAIAAGNEDVQ